MTCEKQNSTKAYILRKVKSVYKHVKDNSGAASGGNLPFNVHVCGFSSMIYNSQNTPSQMSVNNDPFQLNKWHFQIKFTMELMHKLHFP